MTDHKPHSTTRRNLLLGLSAAGLTTACGEGGRAAQPFRAGELPEGMQLPAPEDVPIDHFVFVMMENRSFDHFLGWVPGADGQQAGLAYEDSNGVWHETFPLAPQRYDGCGVHDPAHGYATGRTHFNDGQMDGFLKTVPNGDDIFPAGYYTRGDLPFYAGVADQFTVCDRYFHGLIASTYPNRMYMHTGQTDRVSNSFDVSALPTIWDRMKDAGRSVRYFFSDLPFTALFGQRHLDITSPIAQFYASARAGLLPNLCFVEPRFVGENEGVSNDDHAAGADIRNGQVFLNSIYEALRQSPQWSRTAMVVVYDEWGGFFDHVAPPLRPVSDAEAALPNDGRLGFRTPCVILSPYARARHVSHIPFEPNSLLNMVRYRFGLDPLSVRCESAFNMLAALDFQSPPNLNPPSFDAGLGAPHAVCQGDLPIIGNVIPDANEDMRALRDIALQHGFRFD